MFSKQFASKYEIGEVVGRDHFGYTCSAIVNIVSLRDMKVVVNVIPKAKVSSLPFCLILKAMKCICIL